VRLPLGLALVTAYVTAISGAAQPGESVAFLREVLRFPVSDLRHLAEGRPAIHTLDTVDGREIAIAGAIRVALSPEQYTAQLRDIVEFKRHEAVQQIGTFGVPPRVADVAGLTLDRDHLDDLRDCELRDCDLQLSGGAIERVRTIHWSAPDATEQANRTMREILTELTDSYRRGGDTALMTYDNDKRPLVVADEFRAMMAAPPAVLPRFPLLSRHVTEFPLANGAGIEDLIYWSKEDVGPKVIISVTHMAIQRVDGGGPVAYAVASKQIYGSHYFDSSLGLTLLLRDERPLSAVLVYVNRSRVDVLDGFLGGLKRAVVRSRARAAMADTLERIQKRLPGRVQGPGIRDQGSGIRD
jgi:hypothetical protein